MKISSWFLLFVVLSISWSFSQTRKVFAIKHHSSKRSEITSTNETHHKRSDISTSESSHATFKHSKRGFLANLASLLSDAEKLSLAKRNETGLTSSSSNEPAYTKSTTTVSVSTPKPEAKAATAKAEVAVKKEQITPAISAVAAVNHVTEASSAPGAPVTPEASVSELVTPELVKKELNNHGKDYAPIFALYKGKIVPLGKLPDTAFKKSSPQHPAVDEKTSSAALVAPKNENSLIEETKVNEPAATISTTASISQDDAAKQSAQSSFTALKDSTTKTTDPTSSESLITSSSEAASVAAASASVRTVEMPVASKDVTGTARFEIPQLQIQHQAPRHMVVSHMSPHAAVNEETIDASRSHNEDTAKTVKLSKLQSYLSNLDGPIQATGSSHVSKTAKDDIVIPEEMARLAMHSYPKSEIMSHVKGLVLDNGKVVSVDSSHGELSSSISGAINEQSVAKLAPEPPKDPDSSDKFYVTDDGNLLPLKPQREKTENAAARTDILDGLASKSSDSGKTVAVSLDMLKELLKKTDTKVSLAQLLNKGQDKTGDDKSSVSSSASSSASDEEEDPGTIEDFAAGGLKAHNSYRSKHHDDNMIWSDDLASKAQKLAEALADKKTLEIAKDLEKEGYGENVAKVWATFKNAGEAATKMWYQQSENYRFDDPHLDENTGQFAQVIWKATKELGMGVAKSIDDVNNKYVYVVSLYRPPGNIEAQLRDNVLPTGNNTIDVYTTFFKRGNLPTTLPNKQ